LLHCEFTKHLSIACYRLDQTCSIAQGGTVFLESQGHRKVIVLPSLLSLVSLRPFALHRTQVRGRDGLAVRELPARIPYDKDHGRHRARANYKRS
jgi:hypothetical protein